MAIADNFGNPVVIAGKLVARGRQLTEVEATLVQLPVEAGSQRIFFFRLLAFFLRIDQLAVQLRAPAGAVAFQRKAGKGVLPVGIAGGNGRARFRFPAPASA